MILLVDLMDNTISKAISLVETIPLEISLIFYLNGDSSISFVLNSLLKLYCLAVWIKINMAIFFIKLAISLLHISILYHYSISLFHIAHVSFFDVRLESSMI